jgi:5-methylcytosine-specific restriction protein A
MRPRAKFYDPCPPRDRKATDRDYDRRRRDLEAVRFYRSKAWRALRAQKAALHAHCQDCLEQRDVLVPLSHVHHVVPIKERPDLALTLSNLRSLCIPCHNRREAAAQSGQPRASVAPPEDHVTHYH